MVDTSGLKPGAHLLSVRVRVSPPAQPKKTPAGVFFVVYFYLSSLPFYLINFHLPIDPAGHFEQ